MKMFIRKYVVITSRIVVGCTVINFANAQVPNNASESSDVFKRLDNNVAITIGNNQNGQFSNAIYGVDATILTNNNIWGNLQVNGLYGMRDNSVEPLQDNSGYTFTGKIGYSMVFAGIVNLIPYIGMQDWGSSTILHNGANSEELFSYSQNTVMMLVGFRPEVALGSRVKLALDNALAYGYQVAAIPSSENGLTHDNHDVNYYILTPSIEWNPFSKFIVEAYYQATYVLLNHTPTYNVVNQGYSSANYANNFLTPGNVLGLRVGVLF